MIRHSGFAAIIGPPNAGKSTLVNALTGQKIAIVTHKAQTTRMCVRGIMMCQKDEIDAQIVLVDTPGIFAPRRRLDRAMVDAAWGAVPDAHVTMMVLDASRPNRQDTALAITGIARGTGRMGVRLFLVLNQIDRADKPDLLVQAATLQKELNFDDVFMISALTGDGLARLSDSLATVMPAAPWLYPPDQVADIPMQLLAAELTREKLFLRVHQEIPYALTVENEEWVRRRDGSVQIRQVIYVTRESQRVIILGAKGQMIKSIGRAARVDIAEALGTEVHLFLFVKIREKWQEDPARYAALGLDYKAR